MSSVRVRFAPSPTGHLHVGGLRTALYNYLFARHFNGKLVLRIEDTDRSRYVEGAVENLIETLKKCGIENDEGPQVGGSHGPYTQSERRDMYAEHAKFLLQSGNAYKCFCTSDRLDKMRESQLAAGLPQQYDGLCRSLDQREIEKNENSGLPYTVRLKVPENETLEMEDMVRGKIEFDTSLIDDQILIKSDGYPTYHLANVVDDHFMDISHVIRGEEWLPSTPKHIIMYKAFGWDIPKFAHLPLLLNHDRSKLSKRQGDVAVEDYLKKGYLPEALINFVVLLGWNPGDDKELFSKDELINEFSIERVNKAGAVFDVAKLNWMNGQYLRNMPDENYLSFVYPFVKEELSLSYDKHQIDQIIMLVKEHLDYGIQAKEHLGVFLSDDISIDSDESLDLIKLGTSKTVFNNFMKAMGNISTLDAATFKQEMKNIQKETGIKGKLLFMPFRIAMTGQMHGLDLATTVEIFGKEKVKARLENALKY